LIQIEEIGRVCLGVNDPIIIIIIIIFSFGSFTPPYTR